MSVSWRLTADDDLDLTNGRLTLVDGADATVQSLRGSYQLWQGEWFLNLRRGVPYSTRVIRKGLNEGDVISIFRATTLDHPDIDSIDELDFTFPTSANRKLTIKGRALRADGGIIDINETLGV